MSEILSLNKVTSIKNLSEDRTMVTYSPKLDYEVIKSNNLDIIKILNKHKDSEIQSLNVSSIVISAAVNAYARVHMQALKLDILSKGGTLYYSDTDSIVTNLELDNSLVDKNELGKLKLEHEIEKAIFIAPKLYVLVTTSGEEIVRAKGVNSKNLQFSDFEDLYRSDKVININKNRTVKD
jgi:hypothetical protein